MRGFDYDNLIINAAMNVEQTADLNKYTKKYSSFLNEKINDAIQDALNQLKNGELKVTKPGIKVVKIDLNQNEILQDEGQEENFDIPEELMKELNENENNDNKKNEEQNINTKETEIKAKINTGNISISLPKNTIEINKSVNSLNKIEEGIKDKSAENSLDNQKLIIENMFNNILNKLKMGNEALKEDILKIQNLMVNITDSNNKLKKDVEKMTEEMQKKNLEIVKLNQDIGNLNQDIENLEERVGFLEEDCEEMKETISKIQFRDLSKNFLKCFNRYLTNEELELIKKKKHLRGDIISNKIGQLYPNADKKKMAVIQNLVKSSSDLIKEGNYLAHSITINQYDNEIEYYKKKKNLEKVKSPVIFCFVYFLGISQEFDDLFENSYAFLRLFFNRNLKSSKYEDLLDIYFNY